MPSGVYIRTKKIISWNKGLTKETDTRVKNHSISMRGKVRPRRSDEFKEKQRKSKLGDRNPMFGKHSWNYGITKEVDSRLMQTEESKIKKREKMRKNWRDPKFQKKMRDVTFIKPNKLELFFESWLNKNLPNEWKYVGNGQLIIAGKCPDFVNINGKKQIIELYGDYWHRGENPEDRIKVFEPFGY